MGERVIKIFNVWKEVFSNGKYLLIAFVSALAVYIVYFLTSAYGNIISYFQGNGFIEAINFTFFIFMNFRQTILPSSFISMILLSAFTGILIAILLYRVNVIEKSEYKNLGIIGGLGVFLGVLAPGCVSCGLGVIALLGFSGVLATLPFKGLEISYLALGLLIFSIIQVSLKIDEINRCEINIKNNKLKGGIK